MTNKTFSAPFNPEAPLRFLKTVFKFLAKESDLFKSDNLVNNVSAVVEMVKGEMEAEKKNKEQETRPPAPNYCWGESIEEVVIAVPVPPGTKETSITCVITKNHLKVGLKGQPAVIDGELYRPVRVNDRGTKWILEDQNSIAIHLTKQDKMEWKYLLKGDQMIDTTKSSTKDRNK